MKCKSCKFWDETNESLGTCHRYAPHPMVKDANGTENRISVMPLWPKTKADQWCGEWSVRVEVEP